MNPNIGGANVTESLAVQQYNSLQIELRRRLSRGLLGAGELHVREEVR